MAGLKKRVTMKLKSPNPLFMEWLTEWRDNAIEKDSKMQYAFTTALSSLKKYPLPLETGRDCKILHGFGDKLCQMLDSRLSRHKESASTSGVTSSGKKRKLSTPSKRVYVPTVRSGAYAILVTLYRKSLLPSFSGFMYKSDIIADGQHLCNKSFTKPDAGSFYTSWSSMKTLLDKNLVTKKGNPAKFSLTDEGIVLASQLSNSENNSDVDDDVFMLPDEDLFNSRPILNPGNVRGNGAKRSKKNATAGAPRKVSNKRNNKPSQLSNSENNSDVDDDVFMPPDEDLFNSRPILNPNNVRGNGAKRSKKNATAAAPRKVSTKRNNKPSQLSNSEDDSDEDGVFKAAEEEDLMNWQPILNAKGSGAKRPKKNKVTAAPQEASNKNNNVIQLLSSSENDSDDDGVFKAPDEENLMNWQPISNVKHDNAEISGANRLKGKDASAPLKVSNKKNNRANASDDELMNVDDAVATCSQIELFSFMPFSFEIILLIDKNEKLGNSKDLPEDPALSILNRLNVNYELRHLKVGDYTWICRQKTSKNELILPYIVERKRMDDLGGSIKNGRFHEQKFRLKQSGIQNLIYLVESFGSNTHTGLPVSSLYQAATNTLIQDQFCVKFTDDMRGSMEYLATFTTLLNKMYKAKTLNSCAKDNLVPSTIKNDTISLMTFNEFNKGSSKSRHFKVQEMLIRQLLQIKGISVEKALAITEMYPTPLLLYRMYCNISSNEGEKLLTSIQFGKLKKKIGLVISKTVYQLFTSENF